MGGNNQRGYIPEVNNHGGGTQSTDDLISIIIKSKSFSCKILLENDNYGSGFFCRIIKEEKISKFLFTCNHVLTKDFLRNNNEINIEFNKEKRKLKIKDRLIWTNENLDYTAIGILNSDNIKEFLKIEDDDEMFNENYEINKLIEEEVILFANNKDNTDKDSKQSSEFGIIKNYKRKQFSATYNSSYGASGGAVLLKKGYKLIGMHVGHIKNKNIFIPINLIINDMNSNKNSFYDLKKEKGNNEGNINPINIIEKEDNKIIEIKNIANNKEQKGKNVPEKEEVIEGINSLKEHINDKDIKPYLESLNFFTKIKFISENFSENIKNNYLENPNLSNLLSIESFINYFIDYTIYNKDNNQRELLRKNPQKLFSFFLDELHKIFNNNEEKKKIK